MREQWRDIPEYEGYYQASNLGRIRSLDRIVPHARAGTLRLSGKIMKVSLMNRYGHFGLVLRKDGLKWAVSVHQLIAITWIGPCPNGKEVCHGPNGIADNSIGNLSYRTHQQNQLDMRRDGTHTGRPVRRSDGVEFISLSIAAEETGCGDSNIGTVCKGKRKSAGGYGWEYI